MKIRSSNLLSNICVISGILFCTADGNEYHWGNPLTNWSHPMSGDFLYEIYNLQSDNPLFDGNQAFLEQEETNPDSITRVPGDFERIKTLGLIGHDSIFVHVYSPMIMKSHAKYLMLLYDAKQKKRLLLNNLTPESFSAFWHHYNDKEQDIDYLALSHLYVIFTHMDNYVYFIEDHLDISIAHQIAGGPTFRSQSGIKSEDLYLANAEWTKRISRPCIRRLKNNTDVEFYVYVLDEVKVYRYLFAYTDDIMTYMESEIVSPTKPQRE